MYKNFKISDEERQQIMEMHKSHGYKQPVELINEDWGGFWKGVKNFFTKTVPGMMYGKTSGGATGATGATAAKTTKANTLADVAKGSYIMQGMSGDAVTQLQKALNATKDPELKVNEDGSFGGNTLAAVTKLQQKLGVKPKSGKYGVFGPITMKALSAAVDNNGQLKTASNQQVVAGADQNAGDQNATGTNQNAAGTNQNAGDQNQTNG